MCRAPPAFQPAAATARLARTGIRCARYSGDACRSPFNPDALITTAFAAAAVKLFVKAASNSLERNTDGAAPVTATRTPLAVCATKTPTRPNRDAGLGNFTYAAFRGIGKDTDVMISPSASAVSYMPLKN